MLNEMILRFKQSHFSIIPREVSDATPAGSTEATGPTRRDVDRNGNIGVTLRDIDNTMIVTDVREGSTAARAGVRTGYVLESVNGCPLASRLARIPPALGDRRVKLSAWQLTNTMLSGPVGDTVRVVWRDAREKAVPQALVREPEPGTVVKFGNLPPLNSHLEHERRRVDGRTIGIIRFNIWMTVLAPAFDAAIDSLRDADAIVLDVRGNFGGVGGLSMGIAGHFLDSVVSIGTMMQRGTNLKFVANPRRVNTRAQRVKPFAGPLALVVDELSISTTEIFAGGLQAIGRARVFGVQTSGQALPAVAERLPNGDILYHAIANFVSPTGKPIEGDGVLPDVVVPSTRRALLRGQDAALESALKWAAKAVTAPGNNGPRVTP